MEAARDSDHQLLRNFTEAGDEAAFNRLVQRHSGFVYSVALRESGNADLSKDVTQQVFISLAKRARVLCASGGLGLWLHEVTRNKARDLGRAETRRRRREAIALQNFSDQPSSGFWERLAPEIDLLVARLPRTDRHAILLRFYMGHSYEEVGRQLHSSSEAARKRCDRALEKMRGFLSERGIAASGSGLASLLAANAAVSAPAGTLEGLGLMAPLAPAGISPVFSFFVMNTPPKLALTVACSTAILGTAAYVRTKRADPVPEPQRASSGVSNNLSSLPRVSQRTQEAAAGRQGSSRSERLRSEPLSLMKLDGPDQYNALHDLAANLSSEELKEAYLCIESLGSSHDHREAGNIVLEAWMRKDPDGAIAWAKESKQDQLGPMLSIWAGQNSQAAIAWATANGSDLDGGNSYNRSIIEGLPPGPDSFAAANELITGMADSPARLVAVGAVASRAEALGPEYARNWISTLPEDLRDAGFHYSVLSLAAKDPVRTIDWMRESNLGVDGEGLTSSSAMGQILREIAPGDRKAVLSYLNELPEGPEKGRWLVEFQKLTAENTR